MIVVIITLYLKDRLINFRLPTIISGSFSFDYEENENSLINIEAKNGNWNLYSLEDMIIFANQKQVKSITLKANEYYVIKREEQLYLIYTSNPKEQKILTYDYINNFDLTIGNANDVNIIRNCPYFNNLLFQISITNQGLSILNKGNSGLYVNDKAINKKNYLIKTGDELNIYGLRIFFLKSFFVIISCESIDLKSFSPHIYEQDQLPKNFDFKDRDLYLPNDYYSKAPRIRRNIEEKTIKISPPPEEDKNELPLILVIGPMLTMGVTGAAMLINTVSSIAQKTTSFQESWPQLIMSGAMLISMLVWPLITQFYNRNQKKKHKKEIIQKYNKYLAKKEQTLKNEMDLQKVILLENLITIEDCLSIITNKNMNFWDKRPDQNDFLTLRVGTGNQRLNVKIEYNEEEFKIDENELREQAENLINKYKYIPDVPIGYSFYDNFITAIMGNYQKTLGFVNNILLQLLTFYTYEDIKIVLFTNEKNASIWEYLKYLNHNFNDDKTLRFFSTNKESAKNLAEFLSFEATNRLNESSNKNFSPKPYYIIIIDEIDEIKRFDFIKTITENEQNLGFSIIFIENKLSRLPSKCTNFINLGERSSEILINAYENQEKISFNDEIHYNIDMINLVKKLANIPIEFEKGMGHLPNTINFLEMENVGKVEQLNILNRWERNDATLSLKAEVGVDEQGDLLYLDLHEKYHGPHGLIAGTTGSGKSEFIITYILSLAINYSPDDVSFILIDYKGGGLAYAFENKANNLVLPHLAGTITNLDKSEIDRALVSINSEIKRRQTIFNEARDLLSESTIDIYKYQRYYNEGRLDKPIPHLFIICDEFAELKVNQPDFMDDLISVARIGRSLGVHLILATQKPTGVVNDQIWSNTRFRVCLKVSDEQDSREMLKRPEAAAIKQTGRFYLQVGYDEYFVLGQSAYAGANYYPADKYIKHVDKSINFINDCGMFIKNIQASNQINVKSEGEQLTVILKNIIDVAQRLNMKSKRLWLESLPSEEIIPNLQKKYNYQKKQDIEVIIGEYDAPEFQKQNLAIYSYLKNGNTIIYGNDGEENELLLNTLIYESSKNYLASEINFYIIDYGSESLVKYSKLPHVGGLVLALEEEKYNNLWKLVKEDIKKRKKLLADFNGDFRLYNEKNEKKLPIKVIIMNNYDSIYEANQSLYDELPELVRDSERYGIIFIITANQTNSVHTKISQNCPNIIAYKLKDESDYRSLYGIHSKLVPKNIFGRGLIEIDDFLYEFQTAIPFSLTTNSNFQITNFVTEQQEINRQKAIKIPTLPDVVRLKDVEEYINNLKLLPIAISKNDLEVLSLDFTNNIGYLVSANKINSIKNFVLSLILEISTIKNTQLIILDATHSLSLNKENYPNYYTNNFDAVIDSLITYLNNLINQKRNLQGIIIFYGLDKFITAIDKEKMNELIRLIKKYENIYLIVAETASKLKNYMFEEWFTKTFNLNEGIWLGKGITDQTLLRISNITKEMTKEYDGDMGYIINEGVPVLSKLIDFINKEE